MTSLDEILVESIREACAEEGTESSQSAIIKFVEHYLAKDISVAEFPSKLQDIYELLKD